MFDFMQALQGGAEAVEGVPMVPEDIDQNLVIFPSGAGVDRNKGLPAGIVVIVQLLAFLWEFGVVAIVMLPWWSILFSIALLDWSLDWVFLGLFFWCKFCAGIFIWTINIAMIPFMIWGWLQRAYLETFGLIVDGWMLIFNFSGCYLRFGRHCWYVKRAKYRNMRTLWDIPIMHTDPNIQSLAASITSPTVTNKEEFLQMRRQNRRLLTDALPGSALFNLAYDAINDIIDF